MPVIADLNRAPPTKTQAFTRGLPFVAYTVYTIVRVLMLLPFYILKYLVPALRQTPRLNFAQALGTRLIRVGLRWASMTEIPTPQLTSVRKNLGEYVHLHPAHGTFYQDLLSDMDIQPLPVGAVWVPAAPKGAVKEGQLITLHMHGGAYVMLSPGGRASQDGPRCIAKELGSPVMMLDYRLSCNPRSCFPAALQDAITAYKSLLDQGYAAKQIVVSGDSAGGHLVLSLLRYIAEHPKQLPAPAAAFLWSPWTDMTSTNESIRSHRNFHVDYIDVPLVAWALREFVLRGEPRSGPYFSPRYHPFKTDTRLFIQGGTSEAIVDATKDLAAGFSKIPGNIVELVETLDAIHDIFAGASGLGFAKERRTFIKEAHDFVKRPVRADVGKIIDDSKHTVL